MIGVHPQSRGGVARIRLDARRCRELFQTVPFIVFRELLLLAFQLLGS